MKSETDISWRTTIGIAGPLFMTLFVAACGGSGSTSGGGGGKSALTLAATYTLPGTTDSVQIYDDSSTNTEFSASQISDIEMGLSGIPPSMLNSVNWVVPESSAGISDPPSTGRGIVVFATPADYVGSARQSTFASLLGQAGADIYAANKQVGDGAEWQQLIAAGGPYAEAGFDFPDQFEFWIENSVQDMLSLVNDALLNNKVTAAQVAFLGMSSFFNSDHTLNVYYTGPDINTTSFYMGTQWTELDITPIKITRTPTGFSMPAFYGFGPVSFTLDNSGQAITSYTYGSTRTLRQPITLPAEFLSQINSSP